MQEILLLHGAIGDSEQLKPLYKLLAVDHIVYRLNFNGHGGTPFSGYPFSIEGFAQEVIDFLSVHHINSINIFGFSMGGYVAMYLAKHYPEKVNKLITLATKFHWDDTVAAKELTLLDPQQIAEKIPAFAAQLKKSHNPQDWKIVLHKTAEMLLKMGNSNTIKMQEYQSIKQPVLVMLGDRDKMVSLEETTKIYRQLPNAELLILPETQHPIESVNIHRLAVEIKSFLQ